MLNQVISAVPTPPGPGAPRIPPEVDKVLRRALSKNRADRFPTIRAFARAFEAAALPARAGVAPRRGTPHTPLRSVAVEGPQHPAPEAARVDVEKTGPRHRVRTWLALLAVLAILGGAGWLLRGEPPISTWLQRAHEALPGR